MTKPNSENIWIVDLRFSRKLSRAFCSDIRRDSVLGYPDCCGSNALPEPCEHAGRRPCYIRGLHGTITSDDEPIVMFLELL